MSYTNSTKINNKIQINGNGLFSKEEVTVSISKLKEGKGTGIFFVINNERIEANVKNVSNSTRNTVLSCGTESICLIEHFLSACSVLGVNNIEVECNKNELVFGDGSALHWYEALKKTDLCNQVSPKYELKEPVFIKNENKEMLAIPSKGFKASYYMDWNHPALGKLWASWSPDEPEALKKLLRARTFGTKQENDFFGVSDWALTLGENDFNKELHEPLEPVYHKILDIIGDLKLSGINPLEINMHVIGFKSGHELNVEMAEELAKNVTG